VFCKNILELKAAKAQCYFVVISIKKNDWFLLGALGLAGYFYFTRKSAAAGGGGGYTESAWGGNPFTDWLTGATMNAAGTIAGAAANTALAPFDPLGIIRGSIDAAFSLSKQAIQAAIDVTNPAMQPAPPQKANQTQQQESQLPTVSPLIPQITVQQAMVAAQGAAAAAAATLNTGSRPAVAATPQGNIPVIIEPQRAGGQVGNVILIAGKPSSYQQYTAQRAALTPITGGLSSNQQLAAQRMGISNVQYAAKFVK
jgi:hypothetical protein